MTHPEELLAGYVDGSLSTDERASVDAHRETCARCRAEVELARIGRTALKSLPDPLAPDLRTAISLELGGALSDTGGERVRAWYRYAGLAAAAVVAIAIVVSLPGVGSRPADDRDLAAQAGAAPTIGAAETLRDLVLELQDTDYDTVAVQALARDTSRVVSSSAPTSAATAAVPVGTAEQTRRAQACVVEAFPGFPGTPTRLISARFEGTPAYLALVLEGPAPGRPADTASVWVADHATCRPLSFTSARI